jgi:hypothetical protein
MLKWLWLLALPALLTGTKPLRAQGNYEIQVYGAATVEPKSTMVELHSNFTPDGQKYVIDGVYPTNHQLHETLEITQGLTSWSEVGFYVFTPPAGPGSGLMALAGGRQSFNGNWLSARRLFPGYLDLGDSSHRR